MQEGEEDHENVGIYAALNVGHLDRHVRHVHLNFRLLARVHRDPDDEARVAQLSRPEQYRSIVFVQSLSFVLLWCSRAFVSKWFRFSSAFSLGISV